MARMHSPPHPGLVLREDVLPELKLTVTEAASQLGVSRVALSRVINGRAAISADLALRLAKWLGGRADTWLQAQLQYDLWNAQQRNADVIKRLRPVMEP
jgi:antitoxin HigA-1